MNNICAVVLAGGSGTRLWPKSRSMRPKQFLKIDGEDTMIQATFKRLDKLKIESSITICNNDHRFFVAEQLNEIDRLGKIIIEQEGRNTAPAITLAALSVQEDTLLLVLSADHLISDRDAFTKIINKGVDHAKSGKMVVFGVEPTEAHTGYGYIKKGDGKGGCFDVDSFTEKPSLEAAREYIKSDSYLWNSGMFLFKAGSFLNEIKKHRPNIFNACTSAMHNSIHDLDFIRPDSNAFSACPSESIDYAVMENTDNSMVVSFNSEWSDIGSWKSLWNIAKKDKYGNACYGDVIAHKTTNCLIDSEVQLVSTVNVDNLIIVSTKDALVVADKDSSEDIKLIVDTLKEKSRPEWSLHREVHRPWGKYDSIDNGEGFQVKRLTVKPNQKLSVQMHHHRSEHWVVVQGVARVHYGKIYKDLKVNESTYHDVEVIHSLENTTNNNLILIEVQVGTYLGEDDIVRFDDKYGRTED